MSDRMCTCSVHCPESPYHERACCEQIVCGCWCHQKHTRNERFLDTLVEELQTMSDADALEGENAESLIKLGEHLLTSAREEAREPWEATDKYGRADLTIHPIMREAYKVACLIERCGASEELTAASSAAFALCERLSDVLRQRDELLAIAKQYASECEICGGSGQLRGDGWQKPCDACADIRAVISRAEGRSDG